MELSLTDIEARMRSKRNVIEYFSFAKNEYYPDLSCFNTDFLKLVLMEEKCLLPLDCTFAPKMGRLKTMKDFDRKTLFDIINNSPNLHKYIPNNISYEQLSREFMLMLIYSKDKIKFNELYLSYKKQKHLNEKRIKETTKTFVSAKYKDTLLKFEPSFIEPKSKSYFAMNTSNLKNKIKRRMS